MFECEFWVLVIHRDYPFPMSRVGGERNRMQGWAELHRGSLARQQPNLRASGAIGAGAAAKPSGASQSRCPLEIHGSRSFQGARQAAFTSTWAGLFVGLPSVDANAFLKEEQPKGAVAPKKKKKEVRNCLSHSNIKRR